MFSQYANEMRLGVGSSSIYEQPLVLPHSMHRLQDPPLTISEPQNWQSGASPSLCDLPQAFDYTGHLTLRLGRPRQFTCRVVRLDRKAIRPRAKRLLKLRADKSES